MPVMSCDCGKQLRVADEHIGKKIRCPGCGETLVVEDPDAKAPSKKPAAKTPEKSTSGGMVTFTCDCGKKMQAKAEFAGKSVKCPDCGEGVKVPGKTSSRDDIDFGDAEEDAPRRKSSTTTSRKAAAIQDDDDEDDRPARRGRKDDDEDEDDRPSRKSKKGKKARSGGGGGMMWLMIGGGVVGLLLVGLLVWWMFSGGPSADMALVPGNSAGFVAVRVGDLMKSELGTALLADMPAAERKQMEEFETKLGVRLTDIERFTVVGNSAADFMNGGKQAAGPPDDMFAIVLLSKAADEKKITESLGNPPATDHKSKKFYTAGPVCYYFHNDKTILLGSPVGIKKAIDQAVSPQTSGNLAEAAASVRKQHVVIAVAPPKEMMAAGPKQAADVRYVLAAFNVTGKTLDLDATVAFASSASAADAKKELDPVLPMAKMAAGQIPDATAAAMVGQLADNLKVVQSGASITVATKVTVDIAAIKKAAGGLGGLGGFGMGGPGPNPGQPNPGNPGGGIVNSAQDMSTQNNLKQIALAMLAYHDAHRKLPPYAHFTGAGPQKQPQHSWRVLILPFLGQDALFNQIKLDEPWDSAHNRTHWSKMPPVYATPGRSNLGGAGLTAYQVFVGPNAVFDKQGTPRPLIGIPDGSSNTLLVVEAANSVPWMKPEDIEFAPGANGFALLGKVPTGQRGFFAVMCDGSTRRILPSMTPRDFQNAILINDANVVTFP